jgi:hypothetical protein
MDYLLDAVPAGVRGTFASVSPIFCPSAPGNEPVKPQGEFWVCIPGELEFRRRDYVGLAEALRATPPHPAMRFLLVGSARTPDGGRFAEMIREAGLESRFVLFREYVAQDLFNGYVARSDVVLPLTHPGIELYTHYRRYQVSGTFLQALRYSRPLLLDRSWAGVPEFDEIALFYDLPALVATLNSLAADHRALGDVHERFARSPRFSFATHQKRFLDLLRPATV